MSDTNFKQWLFFLNSIPCDSTLPNDPKSHAWVLRLGITTIKKKRKIRNIPSLALSSAFTVSITKGRLSPWSTQLWLCYLHMKWKSIWKTDQHCTLLVVGVISNRFFTKFSISLPRSFLQFEWSKDKSKIFYDEAQQWNATELYRGESHSSPHCNILRMLCHADPRIFRYPHVSHHQILNSQLSETLIFHKDAENHRMLPTVMTGKINLQLMHLCSQNSCKTERKCSILINLQQKNEQKDRILIALLTSQMIQETCTSNT